LGKGNRHRKRRRARDLSERETKSWRGGKLERDEDKLEDPHVRGVSFIDENAVNEP
jgi:hypothetical protein